MILKHYDLVPPVTEFPLSQGVNNTIVGIRTGNGDYALKHFNAPNSLNGLKYEHDLLRWLTEQSLSFAVPAPVETHSGQTYYQDTDGLHILMPLLKGHRPNHQNLVQIQAIGTALGELQIALRNYPMSPRPNTVSFNDLNNIHPRLPSPQSLTPQDIGWPQTSTTHQLCDWWREEVASLQTFLTNIYPHLPKQVIHGDMAPSNTLFQNSTLSAILDFEFSCPDVRIIDVASGLKFSMRIDENDNPWEIGTHFCQGYQSKITLTELECTSLIDIMILRDVVSTIWWLGRHLDDNKMPETNRMEELRSFKAWLSAHRAQLEALWSQ